MIGAIVVGKKVSNRFELSKTQHQSAQGNQQSALLADGAKNFDLDLMDRFLCVGNVNLTVRFWVINPYARRRSFGQARVARGSLLAYRDRTLARPGHFWNLRIIPMYEELGTLTIVV